MFVIQHKAILSILGGMIYFGSAKSLPAHTMVAWQESSAISSFSEKRSVPNENKGYRDIVAYNDQFLAVGTGWKD